MTFTYHCPNCDCALEITYTFGEDAKTYGPPEQCHDGWPSEYGPEQCSKCGEALNSADIEEKAAEWAEDLATERAIARYEAMQESRWFGRD